VPVTEAAYLTPDQVRSLLIAPKTSRYALLFELPVDTVLRRGEALALHWSDLDF
jgi:integrase